MTTSSNAQHFGTAENTRLAQQAVAGLGPTFDEKLAGGASSNIAAKIDSTESDINAIWIRMRQQAQESMP